MVALIPTDIVSYFRTFFFTLDLLSIDVHFIVEGFFFVISAVFYFPPSDCIPTAEASTQFTSQCQTLHGIAMWKII